MNAEYRFPAAVWRWDGPAGWHFVSLPEDIADEIEERFGSTAKGFGSVRVQVTIGATTWETSLFPDNKRATYLLPVKQAVRRAEQLSDGTVADVRLAIG
jgi:hypothetical protein